MDAELQSVLQELAAVSEWRRPCVMPCMCVWAPARSVSAASWLPPASEHGPSLPLHAGAEPLAEPEEERRAERMPEVRAGGWTAPAGRFLRAIMA